MIIYFENGMFLHSIEFPFFISINQIDTCHTTNISKGGWFIRLFKKHLKLIKKKKNHKNEFMKKKKKKLIKIIIYKKHTKILQKKVYKFQLRYYSRMYT